MITVGNPHLQEVVPIFTVKYYHSRTHFLLAKDPMLIGKNNRSLLSLVIHTPYIVVFPIFVEGLDEGYIYVFVPYMHGEITLFPVFVY